MKHIYSLLIILLVSSVGEVISYLIPLPIPACIYGLIIMFIGLVTGIIPIKKVKSTGKFLIDIMPIMFIPAAVGILDQWTAVKEMLVPIFIAVIPVTLAVMGISGLVTQAMQRYQKKGEDHETDHS